MKVVYISFDGDDFDCKFVVSKVVAIVTHTIWCIVQYDLNSLDRVGVEIARA